MEGRSLGWKVCVFPAGKEYASCLFQPTNRELRCSLSSKQKHHQALQNGSLHPFG